MRKLPRTIISQPTMVMITGQCKPGDPAPDWAHHVRPGTTLAIYMGVRSSQDIAASLMAQGAPHDTAVEICVEVSLDSERRIHTTLAALPATLAEHDVTGVALLLVSLPKVAVSLASSAA